MATSKLNEPDDLPTTEYALSKPAMKTTAASSVTIAGIRRSQDIPCFRTALSTSYLLTLRGADQLQPLGLAFTLHVGIYLIINTRAALLSCLSKIIHKRKIVLKQIPEVMTFKRNNNSKLNFCSFLSIKWMSFTNHRGMNADITTFIITLTAIC